MFKVSAGVILYITILHYAITKYYNEIHTSNIIEVALLSNTYLLGLPPKEQSYSQRNKVTLKVTNFATNLPQTNKEVIEQEILHPITYSI